MSGSKTQKQTQESTVRLSPELQAKYDEVWNMANPLAKADYTPYTGQLTAGLTGNQTAAMNATGAGLNSALELGPYSIMKNLEGFDAGTIAGTDMSQYMNPYTNEVINNTINDLNRSREISMLKNGDSAISQGAFGGDRRGVTDALTNSDFYRQVGDVSSELRQAGYNTALTSAQQDILNRQNNFTSQLGLAGQEASSTNELINNLFGQGSVEQQTNQANLDNLYSQFLEGRDWDKNQTSWLSSILAMQPQTGTTTGTTTQKQSGGSLFGNILGGGLLAASFIPGLGIPAATAKGMTGAGLSLIK